MNTGDSPPTPEPPAITPPLELVIDAIQDAVVGLDQELRVLFFNEAAEKTFGFSRHQVLGQNMSAFPPLFGTLNQLLGTQRHTPSEPFRPQGSLLGQRANGERFPVEGTVDTETLNGRLLHIIVLRDTTSLKQRQQAMAQSQKMLAIGALASGVAHDFNNILTAILSHLDLVASEPNLADGLRENVAYAMTSARRGAELVSKLLTFSRQTEARIEPLNLFDLSAEVVGMLRRSIDRRIQICHEQVSSPLWLVEGDHSQLMQVIMNLCINARDAMPEGGELSLRLENVTRPPPESVPGKATNEFVKLTVSDTGEGMPPEVLSRLFEPYFTTKALGKGTGLGLSIAYGVIADHGGWMEVESKVGAGSQFVAYFARAQTTAEQRLEASTELSGAESSALQGNEMVLVVDDDEMVRLVVRAVLSYRGYQVVEANDGEEAVRKYRDTSPRFDLVLLDLNMPRLNGWDAMAQILEGDPKARIILLSGGMTGGEVERALLMGAKDFLMKPFENPDLVRLVRRILDGGGGQAFGRPGTPSVQGGETL